MDVICAGIRLLKYLRIPLSIIALISSYKAQCHALEDNEYRFDVMLYGGFYTGNEEAWLLEASGCWNVHKNIGLSFGMEVTQQIMMRGHPIMIDGKKAYLDSDYLDIAWIMFKPSVVFKSPYLAINKSNEINLWLQAAPGLILAAPTHNSLKFGPDLYPFGDDVPEYVNKYYTFRNKGLRCFYWNSRFSVNMSLDRYIIGVGYEVSNFDYYSCRRNVMLPSGHKYPVPRKRLAQNVFLSVGCCF